MNYRKSVTSALRRLARGQISLGEESQFYSEKIKIKREMMKHEREKVKIIIDSVKC